MSLEYFTTNRNTCQVLFVILSKIRPKLYAMLCQMLMGVLSVIKVIHIHNVLLDAPIAYIIHNLFGCTILKLHCPKQFVWSQRVITANASTAHVYLLLLMGSLFLIIVYFGTY